MESARQVLRYEDWAGLLTCGCPDPAAGASGECCSLADTLLVDNDAGGLPIGGLGAPSAADDAVRLIDLAPIMSGGLSGYSLWESRTNNANGVTNRGTAVTLDGGAVATAKGVADTNVYTRNTLTEYLVTAPTTNPAGRLITNNFIAVVRPTLRLWWMFGPAIVDAGHHCLCAFGSAPSAVVQPSTVLNFFGLGWDGTDTNVQVMHNDGAGVATKVDTGFAVPLSGRSELFLAQALVSAAGQVAFEVTRMSDLAVFSTLLTTDLPAVGTQGVQSLTAGNIGLNKTVGIGFASYGGSVQY